ncbi:DNA repair protein [Suillus hirtellus]|nr:DNA repair protein [Suillus hirtellus]
MAKPLQSSASTDSSDLFGPDDPEFLEALRNAVLPGDQITAPSADTESLSRKRHRDEIDEQQVETTSHGTLTHRLRDTEDDPEIYGASRFGHFGEYMHRKRAKLQIQNADIGVGTTTKMFSGLSIYINGWTNPSVQDLRQLIVAHGGVFQPYLDKKSLVTHIITCSLTAAKIKEWKHMKIVRPDWLVDSAAAGTLMPWKNYIFKPEARVELHQGAHTPQSYLSTYSRTAACYGMRKHQQPPSNNQVFAATPDSGMTSIAAPEAGHPTSYSPRPLHVTDPGTYKDAARVPGYAAHTSNPLAERVMADPEWRAAHTSVAPDFIEGFYKHLRLHYLSTWKAELKKLVQQAQEEVENGLIHESIGDLQDMAKSSDANMSGAQLAARSPSKRKGKEKAPGLKRVIMHCDFDCFFVAVGLLSHPELRGKPVVVCHSQGSTGGASSTSEIASSSYEARSFGIKNGMSLQQGRRLCPDLMTMPYEFEKYKQLSLRFYTILMRHADDIQAVSVDEALIEVTTSVSRYALRPSSLAFVDDPARSLAEQIRSEVSEGTGCEATVSIGIAENIQLARIATRKAKPAGSFHLKLEDVQEVLAPLDIDDLHGFGHSTRQKANEKLGATNLGELAKKSKAALCDALGKTTGETLYNAIRGIDERKLESDKPRKSVSCDINYGIRFENDGQAKAFIYQMAEEVSRRLNAIDMCGRSLTLKIMKRDPSAPVEGPKFMGHGICETFSKQTLLSSANGRATSDPKDIGDHAWALLDSWGFDPKELRGIGIQVQKLDALSASDTTDPGQVKLPFHARSSKTTIQENTEQDVLPVPRIITEPPSQDDPLQNENEAGPSRPLPTLDLPSFSQVDKDVFNALPGDVKKELENEYQRRSRSPMPAEQPSHDARPTILVKGVNVKRITQQLAPKNRTSVSPRKNTLFAKRDVPSYMRVSKAELRKLDIDPDVFAALPLDLQREQVIMARHARSGNLFQERKIIKASSRAPSAPYRKKPPPQAKHPEPPLLKQQGKQPGEKLYFAETGDVQTVIESWVKGFTEYPPKQKDVDYFSKFLVRNVESADTGIEKTIGVMKWWLILLRRNWEVYERASGAEENHDGKSTAESIGKAWWKAFWEVKAKVDTAARRRFGGSLSLK